MTSDAGALLLGATDRAIGLVERVGVSKNAFRSRVSVLLTGALRRLRSRVVSQIASAPPKNINGKDTQLVASVGFFYSCAVATSHPCS
jgi:hypothetical protein